MHYYINKHQTIMPNILIYTSKLCSYCTMAKRLLDKKAATYTEIDVNATEGIREELILKTRQRTVPQIFIGELHIGGYEELQSLNQQGKLDALLVDNPN